MSRNFLVKRNEVSDPFFDSWFNFPFNVFEDKKHIMKADIIEEDDHYTIMMDMPSIKKENIEISLENGYLTVATEEVQETKEKEERHYICRERYQGKYQRSFYVGEEVSQEDIKASMDSGVLTLTVNKVSPKTAKKTQITIE